MKLRKEDRLQRFEDIQWFFNALPKWVVNPSKYRKSHQTSILHNLSIVRSQLTTLMAEAQEMEDTEGE